MTASPIRIGTRGSALALVQANLVAAALEDAGVAHALVIVETDGDRRAPDTAWGEGAFVAAIERALLAGEVDVAVHSAKDVPTDEDERLHIAAYLPRADPHDGLVVAARSAATGLADLPHGSRIGTDSPRRAGFLRAHRPDLDVRPLHGNVDTRLRRLDAGEADALVLAVAGLARLGREDRITERLPADLVPPAPGQGAIAVQVRADDGPTQTAVARLDDPATRVAVEAERAFLRAAGGGCRSPIGALAEVDGDAVRLLGGVADERGGMSVATIETAVGCAADCAAVLAGTLVASRDRPVALVTRPADRAQPLLASLEGRGVDAVVVPAIAVEPVPAGGPLDSALARLPDAAWAVVTSANGARAVTSAAERLGIDLAAVRWAAVGDATAAELARSGIADAWLPPRARSAAIGTALPVEPGDRVVLFRGSLADGGLPRELCRRGCEVEEVVAYETVEGPATSRAVLERVLDVRPPAAILFASQSAVRGLLALAGSARRTTLLAIPAICIGPATADEARASGFAVLGRSAEQSAAALADLTGRLLHATVPGDVR